MEKYAILGKIGEGAHGLVMKGRNKESGRIVAMKKLLVKNINDGIPINILREIKCLQHADNKFIVQLLEVFPQGSGFVLVFEYAPSGLWERLRDMEQPITLAQAKTYAWMLLQGVHHLHSIRIMHRDLKPANLLITYEGTLKITDFGLARLFLDETEGADGKPRRPFSHQVATRWYRAPELLYGSRNYTHSVDLWAVGCIIAEMINGTPLFPGDTDIEQLAIVLKTLGTPTAETWPDMESLPDYNKISFPKSRAIPWTRIIPDVTQDVRDFVKSFVQYNGANRISAKQALSHQYFYSKPLKIPLADMPKPQDGHREQINSMNSESQSIDGILEDLKTLVP